MPSFPSIPSPAPLFATYLTPSLPFRSRTSSTDSNASTSSTQSTSSELSTAPPKTMSQLQNHTSHLRCARCAADLASTSQIISKGFTGRHGRAWLVAPSPQATGPAASSAANLPNTYMHKPVPRQLVTGAHTVGDLSCAQCGSVLGWKYVAAAEEGQKYKVGKFILETGRICRSSEWQGEEEGGQGLSGVDGGGRSLRHKRVFGPAAAVEEVEFDSQDEDECEDLFMGVWSPQSALKRRQQKRYEGSA